MAHSVGASGSHLGIDSSPDADFHVFEPLSSFEVLVLGEKLSQVGSDLELVWITTIVLASRLRSQQSMLVIRIWLVSLSKFVDCFTPDLEVLLSSFSASHEQTGVALNGFHGPWKHRIFIRLESAPSPHLRLCPPFLASGELQQLFRPCGLHSRGVSDAS